MVRWRRRQAQNGQENLSGLSVPRVSGMLTATISRMMLARIHSNGKDPLRVILRGKPRHRTGRGEARHDSIGCPHDATPWRHRHLSSEMNDHNMDNHENEASWGRARHAGGENTVNDGKV